MKLAEVLIFLAVGLVVQATQLHLDIPVGLSSDTFYISLEVGQHSYNLPVGKL